MEEKKIKTKNELDKFPEWRKRTNKKKKKKKKERKGSHPPLNAPMGLRTGSTAVGVSVRRHAVLRNVLRTIPPPAPPQPPLPLFVVVAMAAMALGRESARGHGRRRSANELIGGGKRCLVLVGYCFFLNPLSVCFFFECVAIIKISLVSLRLVMRMGFEGTRALVVFGSPCSEAPIGGENASLLHSESQKKTAHPTCPSTDGMRYISFPPKMKGEGILHYD